MKITNLKDKDLNPLDGLFTQFWGESSDIDKMAEMFQRLSRDMDYVLLAAKRNDAFLEKRIAKYDEWLGKGRIYNVSKVIPGLGSIQWQGGQDFCPAF